MLFHLSRPWGSDNGVRPRKKYPRNISLLPPLLNNSHDFRNCKLIRTQTFVYHIHTYYICNRSCFLQIKLTDRSNRFVSEFYWRELYFICAATIRRNGSQNKRPTRPNRGHQGWEESFGEGERSRVGGNSLLIATSPLRKFPLRNCYCTLVTNSLVNLVSSPSKQKRRCLIDVPSIFLIETKIR